MHCYETVDIVDENYHRITENSLVSQHAGAPSHHPAPVTDFFPQQWFIKRGFCEWLSRSPDLTPLEFFLYHYGLLLRNASICQEDLRDRVTAPCGEIL